MKNTGIESPQKSQMELSEKTGIDRAQLSKIEQGKVNVTLDTIDRIMNIILLSIFVLIIR